MPRPRLELVHRQEGPTPVDYRFGPRRFIAHIFRRRNERLDITDVITVDEANRSASLIADIDAGKVELVVTPVADAQGDVSGLTVTPLRDGQSLDFALTLPDDGVIASDTAPYTSTGAGGWLRVKVGSATRYINLFTGTPAS